MKINSKNKRGCKIKVRKLNRSILNTVKYYQRKRAMLDMTFTPKIRL